jgi:hypothetical protein
MLNIVVDFLIEITVRIVQYGQLTQLAFLKKRLIMKWNFMEGISMRRNILVACLLFLLTTVIGCSQMDSNKFVLPSEYSHAAGMLDSLTKQGIKIQGIKNSNYMSFFQTKPNYAMFIQSDSGVFELIHLENKNGKEFNIANKEGTDGRFKYTITKNGKDEQLIDSNAETYFNKNNEYITITNEKELNEKFNKLFK